MKIVSLIFATIVAGVVSGGVVQAAEEAPAGPQAEGRIDWSALRREAQERSAKREADREALQKQEAERLAQDLREQNARRAELVRGGNAGPVAQPVLATPPANPVAEPVGEAIHAGAAALAAATAERLARTGWVVDGVRYDDEQAFLAARAAARDQEARRQEEHRLRLQEAAQAALKEGEERAAREHGEWLADNDRRAIQADSVLQQCEVLCNNAIGTIKVLLDKNPPADGVIRNALHGLLLQMAAFALKSTVTRFNALPPEGRKAIIPIMNRTMMVDGEAREGGVKTLAQHCAALVRDYLFDQAALPAAQELREALYQYDVLTWSPDLGLPEPHRIPVRDEHGRAGLRAPWINELNETMSALWQILDNLYDNPARSVEQALNEASPRAAADGQGGYQTIRRYLDQHNLLEAAAMRADGAGNAAMRNGVVTQLLGWRDGIDALLAHLDREAQGGQDVDHLEGEAALLLCR